MPDEGGCPVCAAMGDVYDHAIDTLGVLDDAIQIALEESMKAPQSLDHPWDRGYRAGAAAVWSKLRALRHS